MMPRHTDLTFITNEKEQNLLERFRVLVKDTEFFDCLVGYFYTSGFHALYPSLQNTKKIRILIGISTNRQTLDLIRQSQTLNFSHAETKAHFAGQLVEEMAHAEDSQQVEQGVRQFIDWLKNGKLEIRAHPTENIHAKLYIMSFSEDDRDVGRVITGSSNFTQSGLLSNIEFNVELKTHADYQFAKNKFAELWEDAVELGDKYTETIRQKTWLNDTITPYQLYLKFLYEYFKDDLRHADEMRLRYAPPEFKRLQYQEQAVLNARKILEEYGGVFISDVVGLGKTYMSAMLAGQLDGRHLVLAPPALLDDKNPASWKNVFSDFNTPVDCQSIGKLDSLIRRGTNKYKNVFIDEAHRFRTENNTTYEKLAQICRGKRVILITATPFNNHPADILSQIKLFQNAKKSGIPNVADLETFFKDLVRKLNGVDRQKERDKYIRIAKENAQHIRENVLKYLMVRRTRREIEDYFADDLKNQGIKFPKVKDPQAVFYQLTPRESEVFNRTLRAVTKAFKYARYTPMLYYTGGAKADGTVKQSQENMRRFMKILLVKRLESSFHAFGRTIGRFISYYGLFLAELDNGRVLVSKKHTAKIFEFFSNDDEESIENLISAGDAESYPAEDFHASFRADLANDLAILKQIQQDWAGIDRDPKLLALTRLLSTDRILKENKVIVFTESKETADYLGANLTRQKIPGKALVFTGASTVATREKVINNFDANVRRKRNEYRILIATEVLAEGVNLHRSNAVINYDIPWNPTRLMQRVGRINRVDTAFAQIHSYNFFPTDESNTEIKLTEAAQAKIQAFITLLGADAPLLNDGEAIESYELFNRLTSKHTITGEDHDEPSELKYLKIIRDISGKNPALFEQIKNLPKKARTAKKHSGKQNQLLTYFRKGKVQKFFITRTNTDAAEINFMDAAARLESAADTPRQPLPPDFYGKLAANKQAFRYATTAAAEPTHAPTAADSSTRLIKILKAFRDSPQYTEEQKNYLKQLIERLLQGALPKQTVTTAHKALNAALKSGNTKADTISALLRDNIPAELLGSHIAQNTAHADSPRQIILSEYLSKKE